MKKKLIYIIIITLASISQSCNKDDDSGISKKCEDYDFSSCNFGSPYVPISPQFLFPRFNPKNNNEFIYVKDSSGIRSILKFDLQTKQATLIVDNVVPIHQPDWSTTGWIVFSTPQWKVWRVRDNGSDLKQISFGKNDQCPSFNPGGDKIIYNRAMEYTNADIGSNPSLLYNYKMLIIDIEGNTLDSICASKYGYCSNWWVSNWYSPDKILKVMRGDVGFYDPKTKQDEIPLFKFEGGNGQFIQDFKAFNDSRVFYSMANKGFYEFDKNTNTHHLIRNNCDDLNYNFFSISHDNTRLLVEKEKNIRIDKCRVNQKKSIVIMDLNGGNEQEILLP